jgi:esterase/lipase superfamily enzyme
VHGFNTSFAEAARRTAQISYDLQFEGVPLMFCWPCRGGIEGYAADETAVEGAIEPLHQFLCKTVRHSGATKVHLLAHSMGNRALSRALEKIVQAGTLSTPAFRQVVLAAPDMDSEVFVQLARVIPGAGHRTTLYASSRGRALA